ncbi:MAG: hypothetical protein O3A13_00440 [Proteobacteria bacterium]|nr:hypothetical protein [Pseudomonadota bacterium]MDA0992078.1 hypothetical protein [Pseudomonadota bacterium]
MKCKRIAMLAIIASLSGCATGYSLVAAGPVAVQDLGVQADAGWNRAPAMHTPSARKGAETWTKDGMLLDRLVIAPAIPDGQPIMVSRNKSAALPVFRKDMLPNELEELVESSIVKLFGEGSAVVSTSNLRPHRYGEITGIRFDLEVTVTDSPAYRGTVGAFVGTDNLYLMFFLGAEPHYYDKHIAAASAIIGSARL